MTGEYDFEREMGRVFVTQPDAVTLTYILDRAPKTGGVEAHPTLRDSVILLLSEAKERVSARTGEVVQQLEGPEVDELATALIEIKTGAQPALDHNLIGNIDAHLSHIPDQVVARCGGLALV